jgi:hypothetical protein
MLELSQLVGNFPITKDMASSCSSFLLLPEPKKMKKTEITKLLPQQTVCKLEKKKTGNSHISESPLLRPYG